MKAHDMVAGTRVLGHACALRRHSAGVRYVRWRKPIVDKWDTNVRVSRNYQPQIFQLYITTSEKHFANCSLLNQQTKHVLPPPLGHGPSNHDTNMQHTRHKPTNDSERRRSRFTDRSHFCSSHRGSASTSRYWTSTRYEGPKCC